MLNTFYLHFSVTQVTYVQSEYAKSITNGKNISKSIDYSVPAHQLVSNTLEVAFALLCINEWTSTIPIEPIQMICSTRSISQQSTALFTYMQKYFLQGLNQYNIRNQNNFIIHISTFTACTRHNLRQEKNNYNITAWM